MMASNPTIRILLALALSCLPCRALSVGNQQSYLGASRIPYETRYGVPDDAGDIADILVDAFGAAPEYNYTHQFRDRYPGYDRRCSRELLRREITESPSLWRVLSIPDGAAPKGTRAVSAALWHPVGTSSSPNETSLWPMAALVAMGGEDCSKRLDTNVTRSDHFRAALVAAKETYLDDKYENQVYVMALATHPKWDGHGFAAALLHEAMARAHEMGVPTTLLGTPAGYPLYRSLGFQGVKNITVERLDGLGSFWFEAMVLPLS